MGAISGVYSRQRPPFTDSALQVMKGLCIASYEGPNQGPMASPNLTENRVSQEESSVGNSVVKESSVNVKKGENSRARWKNRHKTVFKGI